MICWTIYNVREQWNPDKDKLNNIRMEIRCELYHSVSATNYLINRTI